MAPRDPFRVCVRGGFAVSLAALALTGFTAFALKGANASAAVFRVQPNATLAVDGHGNGHGHGMSQWGAKGAATAGLSAAQIVAFYYPHTQLTTIAASTVRVLISDDAGDTTVASAPGLSVTAAGALPASPDILGWRLVPYSTGFALQEKTITQGWINASLTMPAQSDFSVPGGQIRLYHGDGSSTVYRGSAGSVRNGSGELTINRIALDDYTIGTAPRESPASWPAAAEQAQAMAARTYARYAVETHTGSLYDICDTDSCQVYGGAARYSASGSFVYGENPAAISGNQNQVLTYNGATIFSQFSASDGGWTVDAGKPYLVAQADPYDNAAGGDPSFNWTRTVSVSSIASHYGLASVNAVEITARDGNGDWGGRVTAGYVDGTDSGGRAQRISTTGFGLQSALNLPHNWFNIRNLAPLGHIDSIVSTAPGSFTLSGWAFDPLNSSASTRVDVYVGSAYLTTIANVSRPDVASAYGLPTAAHGFSLSVNAPSGQSRVCAYAISADASQHTDLGCPTVDVPAPRGHIDAVASKTWNSVTVGGWAYDPLNPAVSTRVDIYVGSAYYTTTANVARPDIAVAFALPSAAHGFSLTVPLPVGTAQLCVYAISADASNHSTLGCQSVAAPSLPFGHIDALTTSTSATVEGWAVDPARLAASSRIDVYLGGAYFTTVANVARPDVAAALGLPSAAHGFSLRVPLPVGTAQLCVYAISADASNHGTLGCQSVTGPSVPFGNVEQVTSSNPMAVSGWAMDPADSAASIRVQVDVGASVYSTTANVARPDVASAFAISSDAHGFSLAVARPAAGTRMCVYAVNAAGSSYATVGCQIVAGSAS